MEAELKKRIISLLYLLLIIVYSLYTSTAFAYSVKLSWNAPTKNADGTALTDLAGYKVYYGPQSRSYSRPFILDSDVTTYKFTGLKPGYTYYFAVRAFDKSGNTSEYSNEASITKYSLKVDKTGSGSGVVTSSDSKINCGSDCRGVYKAGTVVTLTANAGNGSKFDGWQGPCSGTGQCSFTINANTTMPAKFSTESSPIETNLGKIIIDNRDPATSKTGTWNVSVGANPYGTDSVYSSDGATFTWHFTPLKSGRYRVSLWWTERDSRSTNVPVDIQHADGKTKAYVNQKKNGGQWNPIGKYHFKKGFTYAVTIQAQLSPTSTCSDAIKFKLVQ